MLRVVMGGVLVVGLTGCIAPHPTASTSPRTSTPAPSSPSPEASSKTASTGSNGQVHDALEEATRAWRGVPYRLGGNNRRGIDCSALVQNVFANRFALSLPRTTAKQSRLGQRVTREHLQPGDIVFFRPENGVRHSGIYLSKGRFLHASSSSGVRVSSLDTRYWQRRWWQARRLLSPSDVPSRVAAQPAAPSPSSSRRGW